MAGLRLVCFWPGLAGAWYRGNGAQLITALMSAWLAVLLMLATFVWPYWFSLPLTRVLWGLAVLGWSGMIVWEHWRFRLWFSTVRPEATEAYAAAQHEYLRGNWFAAEAGLLSILHDKADDADALLLLVSVLRRTKRWQPALRRLQQLELLDASYRWRFEIEAERRSIQRGMEDAGGQKVANSSETPMLDTANDGDSAFEPHDAPGDVTGDATGDVTGTAKIEESLT